MPLLGTLGSLALVGTIAIIVDFAGDGSARAFARMVFGLVFLRAMGVTLSGVVSGVSDVAGVLL